MNGLHWKAKSEFEQQSVSTERLDCREIGSGQQQLEDLRSLVRVRKPYRKLLRQTLKNIAFSTWDIVR